MYLRISALLILIAASLVGTLAGENRINRITLDHADTLRSRGDVMYLIGSVRAHRADQRMVADYAEYDRRRGVIDLIGSVRLADAKQTMTADRVSFYERSGNYEASGDVDFLRADSIRIRCLRAKYRSEQSLLDLYDNLVIDKLSDGGRITGSRGQWFDDPKVAIIDGEPQYMSPGKGENEQDTLTIKSHRIQFFHDKNEVLFTGEVDMAVADILAVADSLLHKPDSSATILSGAPLLWNGPDELSGRRVRLQFRRGRLDRVLVNGQAVALSEAHPDDERRNRLAGEMLTISIIDDSTRFVHVAGDAEGRYHVWDEDDVYQGVNLSAADVIELFIEKDEVNRIHLEGRVSGAFYPPKDVPAELK